jgi:hypothetical protein
MEQVFEHNDFPMLTSPLVLRTETTESAFRYLRSMSRATTVLIVHARGPRPCATFDSSTPGSLVSLTVFGYDV